MNRSSSEFLSYHDNLESVTNNTWPHTTGGQAQLDLAFCSGQGDLKLDDIVINPWT